MEIADSARKHGIEDKDMLHATRLPISLIRQNDRLLLVIGPDRNAQLLEIVILDPDSDEPVIIHADILRPKFYKYL